MKEKFQWETYVPIFKNRFILKDMGLAIGLPFGVIIVIILLLSGGNISDAKYALLMIALLFILTVLLIIIVYGAKYAPGYIIDEHGITNYTQKTQLKKNRIINGLAIALGLFSGNFSAAGAGMLASSRQIVRVKWSRVRKVRYYPNQCAILIRGGFAEKIVVFCTKENYAAVEAIIRGIVKI